jgi:hypothetical protein
LAFTDPVLLSSLSSLDTSAFEVEPIAGKVFELSVPRYGVLTMRLADAGLDALGSDVDPIGAGENQIWT